jgi:hypothetical protein
MALDIAIEALQQTGWTALNSADCRHDPAGRAYPTLERIGREFEEAGLSLTLRHILLFDCYRAEWRNADGRALGSVVASTRDEAAVFALARLRQRPH